MKNRDLFSCMASIEVLQKVPFTGKTSLAFIQNKEKITNALKTIEAARVKLCEDLAEKDEDGNPKKEKDTYVFTPENEAFLNKGFNELLDTESTIEIVKAKKPSWDTYSFITPEQIEAFRFMEE